MALGAKRRDIVGLVIGDGLKLAGTGVLSASPRRCRWRACCEHSCSALPPPIHSSSCGSVSRWSWWLPRLAIEYQSTRSARKARLCVHGAEQPCLVVNDLKLEPREGGVALWVGPGTEGYFSNLKITAR